MTLSYNESYWRVSITGARSLFLPLNASSVTSGWLAAIKLGSAELFISQDLQSLSGWVSWPKTVVRHAAGIGATTASLTRLDCPNY